jgi:predicted Rossmann fold flavoprotein
MRKLKIAVVGGGAAGFFAISNLKVNDEWIDIHVFEKSKRILDKVRISGGGRCNVCHQPMEGNELIKNYPRGGKSLLGPFSRFGALETFDWFNDRGANLKTEEDGRVFPGSNSSDTIIKILSENSLAQKINLHLSSPIVDIIPEGCGYRLGNQNTNYGLFDFVVFCPGSSSSAYDLLARLNLQVLAPIPSLFTFQTKNTWFTELAGVSLPNVEIKIKEVKYISKGPLLFTHWGLSGPAVLKMSAFGAEVLHKYHYTCEVFIDWIPELCFDELNALFDFEKSQNPSKQFKNHNFIKLPSRFWSGLLQEMSLGHKRMAEISKSEKNLWIQSMKNYAVKVKGKSTFKEEFVTYGGLSLKEVDLKTFELKKYKNFFVAGEILNIDAVTGGFNFQAAWTGAWHIAKSISSKLPE